MRITAFVLFMIMSATSFAQSEKTFRLTPDKSFRTVIEEIRHWRKSDGSFATAPVRLVVEQGEYFFDSPVALGPGDSNLTVKGEGKVVFTCGKAITGWRKNERGHFVTKIPEVASGSGWFDQLYVNHRRATRAKTPNQFYHYIAGQADTAVDPDTGKAFASPRRAFHPREEEVALFKAMAARASSSAPLDDVQIRFFHAWSTSKHRVRHYDPKTNTVLLTGDANWILSYWGDGKLRYEIEGIPEALDQPGEFLLSRDGTLEYIPLPGESLETSRFLAPDAPKKFEETGFLRIVGNFEGIRHEETLADTSPELVHDIRFEGIRFTCDPLTLPDEGLASSQAATNLPASIYVEAARNIAFNECKVSHTGGYAFWFHRACKNCRVERCWMDDMGGGGVRIGTHLQTEPDDPLLTKRIRVVDNIIHGYGRIDASAIGVWIGNAAENEVLHNEISDGFYTGISVGWVWGYAASPSTGNRIEFNHIHDIGQGVLSDMGGVYSLGISPGTTVSNNVIHDVYSYNRYGNGGCGLYTDEGSSNILFENNLVYRVHTGTINQNYGKDNIFRNNILAFSLDGQFARWRNEKHCSFTIEKNIIIWDRGELFNRGFAVNEGRFCLKNNLYWFQPSVRNVPALFEKKGTSQDPQGDKFFRGKSLDEWQKEGNDAGSLVGDPGFVDPMSGDFRFRDGTPNAAVCAIGFKPFDYTRAGLRAEAKSVWGDPAKMFVMPKVTLAPDPPPAPPLKLNDNFESLRFTPFPKASITKPVSQQWKLKITELNVNGRPERVLLERDLPFFESAWKKFEWLGFCAIGRSRATIDLDNILVREVSSDRSKSTSIALSETFDGLSTLPPKGLSMRDEQQRGAFTLLTEGTNKFLRMNDGPEFNAMFNPHCYYHFKSLAGLVAVSFDLRCSPGATLRVDTRQYFPSGEFRSGPALTIRKDAVAPDGGDVVKLPPDRWYRFECNFASDEALLPLPCQLVEENGNHFLRLNDFKEYLYGFMPTVELRPDCRDGFVSGSFKIRLSNDATFSMDGRDKNNPFRNGFTVNFQDGKLYASGRELGRYDTNQWYRVSIKVPLGTDKNRKWSLTLIRCDTNATVVEVADLPLSNKDWSELRWLVFYLPGTSRSTVDLDDIILENTKQ